MYVIRKQKSTGGRQGIHMRDWGRLKDEGWRGSTKSMERPWWGAREKSQFTT